MTKASAGSGDWARGVSAFSYRIRYQTGAESSYRYSITNRATSATGD